MANIPFVSPSDYLISFDIIKSYNPNNGEKTSSKDLRDGLYKFFYSIDSPYDAKYWIERFVNEKNALEIHFMPIPFRLFTSVGRQELMSFVAECIQQRQ